MHARSTVRLGSTLCTPLTVPDGEDKECSNIEDPEKMTEEEKEDVAEKVGEAIEIGNQKAEEEKAAVDAKKAPGDKPKDAKAAGAKKGKIMRGFPSTISAPALSSCLFFTVLYDNIIPLHD